MTAGSFTATRREFGFAPAFLIAIVVHAAVVAFLHYSSLNSAAPPPRPPQAPLEMRFVRVPQESMPVMPQSGTPHPAGSPNSGAPSRPRQMAQINPPQKQSYSHSVQPQPQDMMPATSDEKNPEIAIPNSHGSAANYPDLEDSLHNLDRYISPGAGKTGGSGGGTGGDPNKFADSAAGAYFDTQGYDLGPWGDEVVARVKRNWSIPPAADLGMKGIVGIAFNVNRNGKLSDIRIISPSGIPSFDQAAVNALRISDPFIPLPSDYPRPQLAAVFRFFYNVPVPAK